MEGCEMRPFALPRLSCFSARNNSRLTDFYGIYYWEVLLNFEDIILVKMATITGILQDDILAFSRNVRVTR
jgi:hypothetical protein